MLDELNNQTEIVEEAVAYTQSYANIYQHIQSTSDLITFLNWYATEEITKQLEILIRKLITQSKLNSTVYNILVTPSILISRQVQEMLIIEIPIGRMKTQKQSAQCKSTSDKIHIHEISDYQLSKEQLDNTMMQEIKQKITYLINEFNNNNLEMQSAQINNSIKGNIIMLKKRVKTSGNLHAYYKILLKEKLDLFHYHVNQQKYKQVKSKPQILAIENINKEPKNVINFKIQHRQQDLNVLESTHIFNSND